jgi:choline kinase
MMLEIGGVSLFERQTELLLTNGISSINIVVGYKKEYFTDNRFRYFVNKDYENNNILHSLFYAKDAMNSGFLFSYCDIIYDGVVVRQMLSSGSDIAVAVDPNWIKHYEGRTEHPIEQAELVFSRNGKTVSEIRKHADYDNAVGEFLGIAYFSEVGARILKEVFFDLEEYFSSNPGKPFQTAKTFKQAYMTDMFQELAYRGYAVDIVKIEGNWAEIDTPQDLERVNTIWAASMSDY